MVGTDAFGERRDLRRFKMVDGDRDTLAAQPGSAVSSIVSGRS